MNHMVRVQSPLNYYVLWFYSYVYRYVGSRE
nr:MAG TPA: hypothetical protein [Caudoviricetes sp.]